MTIEHQPGARPEGKFQMSGAEAEPSQGFRRQVEAFARQSRLNTWDYVMLGAGAGYLALEAKDHLMPYMQARNARTARQRVMNRNPSSSSGRREL